MPPFTLVVRFKGMVAFVPNRSYDEMMALMANMEHHHEDSNSKDRARSKEDLEVQDDPIDVHLPHHLNLVFNCREVQGCGAQLPEGFERYPNPDNKPELRDKVRWPLRGGYDIHFLPGGSAMLRHQLHMIGLGSDGDNRRDAINNNDFRKTLDFERLHRGAGNVRSGLLLRRIAPGLRGLVAGRVHVTKGDVFTSRIDPYGRWSFKPRRSARPRVVEQFAAEVTWMVTIIEEMVAVRAAPFDGASRDIIVRPPGASVGFAEVWVENQPELNEWRDYERTLGVIDPAQRPIPYDPHFKNYFRLCRDSASFDPRDLPIPYRPDEPMPLGPGDEPIICPKPRGAASTAVGAELLEEAEKDDLEAK